MSTQPRQLDNDHATVTSLYAPYTRDALRDDLCQTWIDGWQIDYVAYASPETAHRVPVVILGGAFQTFNSYRYCVEPLLTSGPVILVDLPALGSNVQIVNSVTGQRCFDLELEDIAILMARWLDQLGLTVISLMGMSLGSVIAANFASRYPQRMHRLVLMGVMGQSRPSWRMLLLESLALLREERMDEFGQAVILYLVNHARLDETRMSPTAKRLFFQQMADFGENERLRYDINANRLLRIRQVPSPACPVLVATGQYDSFTLPFENAQFALSCPDMQFALVCNADHVPQLQRRKETLQLFVSFLRDEPLEQLEGIRLYDRADLQQMERRGEKRQQLRQSAARLTHRLDDQIQIPVTVVNINYFGVLLDAGSEEQAARLLTMPRDLSLHLTPPLAAVGDTPIADAADKSEVVNKTEAADVITGSLVVELLIFEQAGQQVRALFKHGSFSTAERLIWLLRQPEWVVPDQDSSTA